MASEANVRYVFNVVYEVTVMYTFQGTTFKNRKGL